MIELGSVYRSRASFLSARFMKLRVNSAQNRSKNRPKKNVNKQTNRQTRKQTNLADPELLRGHVWDSQNAYTSRKCLKNLSPKRPRNPANIPVKGHLRLASVVALSSSGACGAIIATAETLIFEIWPKHHPKSSKIAQLLSVITLWAHTIRPGTPPYDGMCAKNLKS